jgi:predicted DsbA family dithiol-disulfide isomerase
MQVEIWSDVVCPWCYLGKRRFERALGSFDHRDEVEVVYRSFELDPSAAPGVSTPTVELLASKYGMSVAQATAAQRQMEQRAAQDGLAFRMDGLRSGNTRDAHRLLQLARSRFGRLSRCVTGLECA